MKFVFLILTIYFIGCKNPESPKDNYQLNKELQKSREKIQRLERLNDSLSEQLNKCNDFVEIMVDN